MKNATPSTLPLLAAACILSACLVNCLAAQPPASGSEDANPTLAEGDPSIDDLLQRLEKIEAELERLRNRQGRLLPDKSDQRLMTLIETPYLGSVYYSSPDAARFFAARLILVNMTASPVTVGREDIGLNVDGGLHKMTDLPPNLRSASFQVGKQNFELKNVRPAAQLVVPSGGSGSTWIVFPELPKGNHIPKLELVINVGKEPTRIDVNEYALSTLGLEVERLGPRECLALLTISGSIDTINAGSLVAALDELATQKVARAVIRWSDNAPPVDRQLLNWLKKAVTEAGRGESVNSPFPIVPVAIRELHLAQIPNVVSENHPNETAPASRIHKTDVDAVNAALASAFEVLPRDGLLEEIEHGHPLSRAAALARGGGRLPADQLPLLLHYTDHNDPVLQRAALFALRHFGEAEVIDKLLHYARKGAEPLATAAIESLAASRYATAHDALLKLLQNEDPGSKKRIVGILARYPRPVWSETIYQFVKDSDPEVAIEALHALATIGHPQLVDVLKQTVQTGNDAMRQQAFEILVSRTDPRSEEIAMEYTLERLKTSPPTDTMYELLRRTKDRKAVPLLLVHLDDSKLNRTQLISTLSRIGDETVAQALAEKYPHFTPHEKGEVLSALENLKSPAFRELAGRALLSSDSSLISRAAQGLRNDGSPQAVRLLIEALKTSNNTSTWSYTTNALGILGTPEAQAALREARDSDDKNKRRYALSALQTLRQRSPGYRYVYHAKRSMQQKNWADAVTKYSMAIKLDPQLSDAYAGRGNALLKLSKNKDAHDDFAKAFEIDPYNSIAATGAAIALVLEGKSEEGIRMVEKVREKFSNDQLFAYNSACVYGRALEELRKEKSTPERARKIEGYESKAVADLKRSVKLGFRDFAWMREDPDLNSLHDLPEYKKILSPDSKDPNDAQESSEDELDGEAIGEPAEG